MARVTRRLAAAVVLVVMAAACASSGSADDESPTSTSGPPGTVAATTTTVPTTVVEPPEADPPLTFPADAGLVDVTTYGAVGDGVTDDTEALQAAVADNVGFHRTLWFPPGTYLVSDSLEWRDTDGEWQPYLTLQGAGRDHTTIRLVDGADGFGDPASPRGVIVTASGLFSGDPFAGGKDYPGLGEGNEAFRNYVNDLTLDTGADNPGVVGIDFIGNNISGAENVTIRSGDLGGHAGLGMTRRWPGPALFTDIEIEGFDYGIEAAHTEYGVTFEDITLRDQQVAGIKNGDNVLSIHRLDSANEVPVISNETGQGMVVLIDAALTGGDPESAAVENAGALYLRSVRTSGYAEVVEGVEGDQVDEYSAPADTGLGTASLALPIQDPPPVDRFRSLDDWTPVTDPAHAGGADPTDEDDDTAAIQAALDSGAPVVYFPATGAQFQGRYAVTGTLNVPAHVERIVGFEALIRGQGDALTDPEATTPVFSIVDDGPAPLQIEGLRLTGSDPLAGGIWFDHASPRDLTLRHMQTGGAVRLGYRGNEGSGQVFLEDVCCGAVSFAAGQQVWARQLNVETSTVPMVANAGAQLWILGIKTELPYTVIETTGSGATELLGGVVYPVQPVAAETPGFIVGDAEVSLIYAVSAYVDETRNYRVQIRADQADIATADVPSRNLGSLVPLYTSG